MIKLPQYSFFLAAAKTEDALVQQSCGQYPGLGSFYYCGCCVPSGVHEMLHTCELEYTCNKYCNLIGHPEVSISHRDLQVFHKDLQVFHRDVYK